MHIRICQLHPTTDQDAISSVSRTSLIPQGCFWYRQKKKKKKTVQSNFMDRRKIALEFLGKT